MLFRIGSVAFVGRDVGVVRLEAGNVGFDCGGILWCLVGIPGACELDKVLVLEVFGEALVSPMLGLSVWFTI